MRAIENIGIVSVYGIRYLTTGNVTQQNYIKYVEHDTLIWEYLVVNIYIKCKRINHFRFKRILPYILLPIWRKNSKEFILARHTGFIDKGKIVWRLYV